MSYTALARKWRPTTFSDLVGQEIIVKALSHALGTDRVHHAYLLTGTRGVGKTTIGRILARALNCEKGVSSTPCGECARCQAIDEGRFIDLIEVDAASRTGVDDTRELLENTQYAPSIGRFKVYLIDEVHMLSKSSFNALLKTLEEPPEHVKFILATTDPEKLPVTVLSRCIQFNLRAIDPLAIEERMAFILSQEGIEAQPEALGLIATAADGSLRDALSLLDQAIALGGGAVQSAQVTAMLGWTNREVIDDLLKHLVARDPVAIHQWVTHARRGAFDPFYILDQIMHACHSAHIGHLVEAQQLPVILADWSLDEVQLVYQIGLNAKGDLRNAPNVWIGLEMVLLRMVAFVAEGSDGSTSSASNDVVQAPHSGAIEQSESSPTTPTQSSSAVAQAQEDGPSDGVASPPKP